MYLQRLLQINMAAMAAMATMLLGMGQRDPTVPLLVFLAAILSVWLTDFTGWFQLNRTVATVAMLGAVLVSVQDLSSLHVMAQLRFIARLLVCFQVILLFQKKDTYWPLAMVSLVQVVVAAAYNQGMLFGVLLVVYLMVALSAMALFFLHRERLCYRPAPLSEKPLPEEPRPAGRVRWALAARSSGFSGSVGRSRAALGRELTRRLLAMGAATLLLTLLLFFTVPRVGGTAWRGAAVGQRQAVGFSDEVTLGELGQIIEKPEEVMRVRFADLDGRPYPVRGGIYLRGAILRHYERGRWRCLATPGPRGPGRRGHCEPLEITNRFSRDGLVRQEITIEPMNRQELFCVWPFAKTEPGVKLLYDDLRERLLRPVGRCTQRFTYKLKTPAFDGGKQAEWVPDDGSTDSDALRRMPTKEGRPAVPELIELADRWIAESGLPPEDHAGKAKWLESRLCDSGLFEYSLEGQSRDLSIDPIEDFITKNRRGHCEYFATALALMLRSQDIPARVVVGYYCDEWNDAGKFHQVRQWHAHAWVEAYLGPRHLPVEMARGERHWEWAAGGWLRLDATPAHEAPGGAKAWFQSIWENYVMELDRSRQYEAIYRPLLNAIKQAARNLCDPQWWRDSASGLVHGARRLVLDCIGGSWTSWRGLVALLLSGAIFMAVGWGVLRLFRRLLRTLKARRKKAVRAARTRIAFFRRLETLLARQGLVRTASQTQHEFARDAGEKIARVHRQDHLAELPVRLADAFYRVRFGGRALDNRQAEEVEQAIEELEGAVSGRPGIT